MRGKCLLGLGGMLCVLAASSAANADVLAYQYDFSLTYLDATVTSPNVADPLLTLSLPAGGATYTDESNGDSGNIDSFSLTVPYTDNGDGTYTAASAVLTATLDNGDTLSDTSVDPYLGSFGTTTMLGLPDLLLNGQPTADGVAYIFPLDLSLGDQSGQVEADIDFNPASTATPLPSSALAGVGLLAVLGGVRMIRKNGVISD